MTDKVSATQADREAAADIWRDLIAKPGECIAEKTMRAGGVMDATPLVQAFARHRAASEQSRVGAVGALRDIQPRAYLYQFADPASGRPVWRSDSGPWNGQTPKATEALYSVEQIAALRTTHSPSEAEVEALEDEITDAIADSFDVDWTARDGARHVVGLLEHNGILTSLSSTTPAPSEAEAEAQRDFIDYHRLQLLSYLLPVVDKLKNWSTINYHIQKLHEGGATAITALSRPSDKTVELLEEAQHAVAGLMSQFDHIGCTCTFPDDTCCAFAMAEARLAKLDAIAAALRTTHSPAEAEVEAKARELCAANFAKKGAEGDFGSVDDCWWAFADQARATFASHRTGTDGEGTHWLDNLLTYHESGGHEGDGSDHALRQARKALSTLRTTHSPSEAEVELREAAQFLADRVRELEGSINDGMAADDYYGHVVPALARIDSHLGEQS